MFSTSQGTRPKIGTAAINVHSGDRYSVMDKTQWMQDEERSFLNDPVSYLGTENFDKLYKIRDI